MGSFTAFARFLRQISGKGVSSLLKVCRKFFAEFSAHLGKLALPLMRADYFNRFL